MADVRVKVGQTVTYKVEDTREDIGNGETGPMLVGDAGGQFTGTVTGFIEQPHDYGTLIVLDNGAEIYDVDIVAIDDVVTVIPAEPEVMVAIPAPPPELGIEWPPTSQPNGTYPGEVPYR